MITNRAEASVSAIDYHFNGLEHLFCAAQDLALAQASEWMNEVLSHLSPFGGARLETPAITALFASLVDDWTERKRHLALAWREAHAACLRPEFARPHAQWCRLWARFWNRFAELTDGQHSAELLMLFFDGEASQHLIRSHRLLDRALLDETVGALFLFAVNGALASSQIRVAHQGRAEAEYRQSFTAGTGDDRLDQVAATILSVEGLSALTFRAVAQKADSTLGAVSYHFGSKATMLRLALQQIYENSAGHSTLEFIESFPASASALLDTVVEAVSNGQAPVLRAMDEITLTLSRSGDHGALGGVIRSFRDPVGLAILNRLLGDPAHTSVALAAAFSSCVRGYGHFCSGMPSETCGPLGKNALSIFLKH